MTKVPEGVPSVSLEIGGKERTLVFTLGTVRRLEREMDLPLHKVFERIQAGRVGDLPVLLWAMMAHAEPDLTPDAVGDMIALDQAAALNEAVTGLMDLSTPEDEGAEGEAEARQTETVASA